jgi:hypothetical protein
MRKTVLKVASLALSACLGVGLVLAFQGQATREAKADGPKPLDCILAAWVPEVVHGNEPLAPNVGFGREPDGSMRPWTEFYYNCTANAVDGCSFCITLEVDWWNPVAMKYETAFGRSEVHHFGCGNQNGVTINAPATMVDIPGHYIIYVKVRRGDCDGPLMYSGLRHVFT